MLKLIGMILLLLKLWTFLLKNKVKTELLIYFVIVEHHILKRCISFIQINIKILRPKLLAKKNTDKITIIF